MTESASVYADSTRCAPVSDWLKARLPQMPPTSVAATMIDAAATRQKVLLLMCCSRTSLDLTVVPWGRRNFTTAGASGHKAEARPSGRALSVGRRQEQEAGQAALPLPSAHCSCLLFDALPDGRASVSRCAIFERRPLGHRRSPRSKPCDRPASEIPPKEFLRTDVHVPL